MSVRSVNTVLYVLLAMAIILYLSLNMPDIGFVYMARDTGYAFVWPDLRAGNENRHGNCSCDGPERLQENVFEEYTPGQAADFNEYMTERASVFDDRMPEHAAHFDDYMPEHAAVYDDHMSEHEAVYDDHMSEHEAISDKYMPGYISEGGGSNTNAADDDLRKGAGGGSGTVGDDLRENASSIFTEEEPKEAKHDISPKGWHLYIDLDEKIMYVYKDGELVKKYEVSGGKPSTPSPLGTWKIISKDTWGEGFGGAWLGFNVPWGKYGIHGTTDPWAVGKSNNSKGCIRMRNKEARELYRLVPHNALVTVVHENRPFYPMRDGDVGSDVLEVERALKKLGYYHGGEDGIFGSSLKNAVMKFQKDNNLYTTGVVNNSTYEKIVQKEKEYDEEQERLRKEREERLRKLEQELE